MDFLETLQSIISNSSEWFVANGIWVVFMFVFFEQFIVLSNFSQGFYAIIVMSFFAYSGHFSLFEVILTTIIASLLGTHLQFFLAQRYGSRILKFFNRFPRLIDLQALEKIKVHRGVIAVSYISGQLRGPVAFVAGASQTPLRFWLIYSSVGILAWAALSIGIGWGAASLFDGDLNQALLWVWQLNSNVLNWIFLAVAIIVLLFAIRKLKKIHSQKDEPPAQLT